MSGPIKVRIDGDRAWVAMSFGEFAETLEGKWVQFVDVDGQPVPTPNREQLITGIVEKIQKLQTDPQLRDVAILLGQMALKPGTRLDPGRFGAQMGGSLHRKSRGRRRRQPDAKTLRCRPHPQTFQSCRRRLVGAPRQRHGLGLEQRDTAVGVA